MTEAAPKSESPRRWLLPLGLAAGVAAALVLRLVGHARYLHDPESLMVPTVGRELGHGHWGDAIHYQYNLIQGGILIDGGLAALGFAAFGDSILAWKWYGIAYAVLGALLGMAVLKKTAGTAGAVLWPLLLMSGPFLLKDGLITPAGHHTSGFVWALAALAVALGGDAEKPTWKRGLAAGLLLGASMFYMRTAISAGPAVALALLRGGWRSILASGVGTLSLPGLAALNAAAFAGSVSPYTDWGFRQTLQVLLYAPRADKLEIDFGAKALEALSWSLRDLSFAPAALPGGGPEPMALMNTAGGVWSGALAAVPVLLAVIAIVVVLRQADEGGKDRLWGTAVIAALGAGYVATYVLSPFRIDKFLLDPSDAVRFAPGLSGPRYVLPAWFALMLGAAHGLGVGIAHARVRFVAVPAAAVLIGLGGAAAAADFAKHREPEDTWSRLRPYHYYKMFGPHRGPDRDVHATCERGDPISHANHLRSLGWHGMPGLEKLKSNPEEVGRAIDDLAAEAGRDLTDEELTFVLHGMGRGLGDELHSAQGLELKRSLDSILRGANALQNRPLGEALLAGFADGFPQDRLRDSGNETFVQRACMPTVYGPVRPLCARFGAAAMNPPIDVLPDMPHTLFESVPHGLIDGPWGQELLRGAGRRLALESPWLVDEVKRRDSSDRRGIVLWPVSLADAFLAGWDEGTAALHWSAGDPWIPTLVP